MRRVAVALALAMAFVPSAGRAATVRASTCEATFDGSGSCTLVYRGSTLWLGGSARGLAGTIITVEKVSTGVKPATPLLWCEIVSVDWGGCVAVRFGSEFGTVGTTKLVCRAQGYGKGTFGCGSEPASG